LEQLVIALFARCGDKAIAMFQRALARHCNSIGRKAVLDTFPHWILFRWSCCAILGAKDVFVKSEHFNSVAASQLQLLSAISTAANRHAIPTALAIFYRTLKEVCVGCFPIHIFWLSDAMSQVDGLADAYLKFVQSIETPGPEVSFLVAGLVRFPNVLTAHKVM
jgi:hypothetical protein